MIDYGKRVEIDTSWLDQGIRVLSNIVQLTAPEIAEAAECARLHLEWVAAHNAKSRADDSKDDPIANARLGYAGQIAFSRFIGVPWKRNLASFKGADVDIFEVRTSARTDVKIKGAEAGRGADPDDTIVVGVQRIRVDEYRMAGWLYARDGKQAAWKRDFAGRSPAYFVPHRFLVAMSDLPWKTPTGRRSERTR